MFTSEVAHELSLDVNRLRSLARSLGVEKRCGSLWWTPQKIELLKQELARQAEALRIKHLYPRTAEVASRLGVREADLRALIHEHGLPVEKDGTGRFYQWTAEAIAAAEAVLDELAKRPPEPSPPPPPGMTSKQVAARLKVRYASFTYFSLTARKRHPSLQPTLHKGTLYWRKQDVALLEQALRVQRERPDLRQTRLIKTQRGRLAKLHEHAHAIWNGVIGMATPQATLARHNVDNILALCQEIEAVLALPATFINTLPVEGWTLRLPVSVWVRAVIGGFEAEAVDFDLRATSSTRRGAIDLLRQALFRQYQELARDPAQDEAAWIAFQQLVVPPE